MFFYIFSAVALNLNNLVDGLENVQYKFNSEKQEIEVNVKKTDISLYFLGAQDIKIRSINSKENAEIQSNGYHIPVNSTLLIKADWAKYDNYIIGFFNEKNCDYVYYSKSASTTFPLYLYQGKKICIYHLNKNSNILIGNKKYSKIARLTGIPEVVELFSSNKLAIEADGKIFIQKRNKNILEEDGDDIFTDKKNGFTYALGFIFISLGGFLYLLVGFVLGSDCCKCCTAKHCNHAKLIAYIDNRDNAFYTKTLEEFHEVIVTVSGSGN